MCVWERGITAFLSKDKEAVSVSDLLKQVTCVLFTYT